MCFCLLYTSLEEETQETLGSETACTSSKIAQQCKVEQQWSSKDRVAAEEAVSYTRLRVSVPMWGTFLSEPLLIVALVGRYPANKLISRITILSLIHISCFNASYVILLQK